jgi:predicted cupin superfamily sugar epimerase
MRVPLRLTAEEIIDLLDLQPLPLEGGYYRENYCSDEPLPHPALPRRFAGERPFSTAIYYLLTADTFSALHRLQSDELFHFYLGAPVSMLQLHPDGSSCVVTLGTDLHSGQQPQLVVPRMVWQGSFLAEGGSWALLGTTNAPGFEWDDFEAGRRDELIAIYPDCEELIVRLTHPGGK